MKIVLGVDRSSRGAPLEAVSLIERLRFPQAAVDVVHIRTPEPYGVWGVEAALPVATFEAIEESGRENADQLVQHVASQIRAGAPMLPEEDDPAPVRGYVVLKASIAGGLLSFAESDRADLIAIDGPQSGPWVELLTGSVARALVTDSHPTSLLLAKDPHKFRKTPNPKAGEVASAFGNARDGLRVVFATDHSPYADCCIGELLRLAPAGISHLTLLTAFPQEDLVTIGSILPGMSISTSEAVRQSLSDRNDHVLRRLAPLLEASGATSQSVVLGLPVTEAIRQTMAESHADLLIVGARGHGFLERLSLGSVALDQAMTTHYSMLILRAKPELNP